MVAGKVQNTAKVIDAAKIELHRLIGEGYKAMNDGCISTIDEVREQINQRRKDRRI